MPSFRDAAYRHVVDARALLSQNRGINADHLAGFAAECALKSILCGAGGVPIPAQGAPKHGTVRFGHLPALWALMQAHVAGLTAFAVPSLGLLLSATNPFASWSVDDRYESGTAVSPQRAADHLGAAERIVRVLQAAELSGVVVL